MKRERIIQQLEMQLTVIEKEIDAADLVSHVGGYWLGQEAATKTVLKMLRDE